MKNIRTLRGIGVALVFVVIAEIIFLTLLDGEWSSGSFLIGWFGAMAYDIGKNGW